MPQFARPSSTISNGTAFVNELGGLPLHASLGEAVANDATYAASNAWQFGSFDQGEVGLSALVDPLSSAGHTVRFRFDVPTFDGANGYFQAWLKCAGATISVSPQQPITGPVGPVAGEWTLTEPEADAIANYGALSIAFAYEDLSFAFTVDGRCTWLEFQVPDAVAAVPKTQSPSFSLYLAAPTAP